MKEQGWEGKRKIVIARNGESNKVKERRMKVKRNETGQKHVPEFISYFTFVLSL